MPRLMLGDRVETVRNFARGEADVLLGVVRDVRTRFDLSQGSKEPASGRGMGGVLGSRGSLAKAPITVVSRTIDNGLRLVQDNAAINRRQLR